MSKMKFESALRYKEEAFIKFKKDFGHAYGSQTYHLLEFDRFCLAEYPHKDTLTEEMVMRWSVIKETETSNGYLSRITTLRQFGKYLAMMGEEAFILPDGLKGGTMPLMPYVFSQESLKSFFQYTDRRKCFCFFFISSLTVYIKIDFRGCIPPYNCRNVFDIQMFIIH